MESENQVLMVVANYNYNDDEYEYTRKALEDNGIGIKITAAEPGVCTSVTGNSIDVDLSLSSVIVDDYKGIIFIGGPGVDEYFSNDEVLDLARKFFDANKIVGAICWAPIILARSGILAHRKASVWDGAKNDLTKAGGIYTGQKVTIDDLIVTADGPEAALEFGQKIALMMR